VKILQTLGPFDRPSYHRPDILQFGTHVQTHYAEGSYNP
jgi:hypothetical protein